MSKTDIKIQPVILSGGSGTRLWPLSRRDFPKQYLSLTSDNTMLQETILRLNGLNGLLDPIIVCNVDHRFLVAEQCQQIGIKNPTILLEPIGRNTAPAIAAASMCSLQESNDPVLLVLSADHAIQDADAFHKAINVAIQQAQRGKLVTFGIVPTDANTGYGYIKFSKRDTGDAYQVEKFVEKPNLETAESYLRQGDYFWNSGMFIFKSKVLLDNLEVHSPEIVTSVNRSVAHAVQDLDFIRLESRAFESSPADSIDYALMEKSDNMMVVPLEASWSDVGTWSSLYYIDTKDANGNVIKGDAIVKDTTNTYVNADHHMVITIGVDNLIVVDTPDATLVSTQDKVSKVKDIVCMLEKNKRNESNRHRKVYRPWGWYDSIEFGSGFQVKRLHVKPWERLSLQMHNKRAEHWVVVSGTATVINGGKEFEMEKGGSTHIPVGIKHSLSNNTNEPLEIIEVQSGVYLGEDDIVRFEDIYGRDKG